MLLSLPLSLEPMKKCPQLRIKKQMFKLHYILFLPSDETEYSSEITGINMNMCLSL